MKRENDLNIQENRKKIKKDENEKKQEKKNVYDIHTTKKIFYYENKNTDIKEKEEKKDLIGPGNHLFQKINNNRAKLFVEYQKNGYPLEEEEEKEEMKEREIKIDKGNYIKMNLKKGKMRNFKNLKTKKNIKGVLTMKDFDKMKKEEDHSEEEDDSEEEEEDDSEEEEIISFDEKEEIDLDEIIKIFGYEKYLNGQREVIERLIKKESVLYINSTGSGKSLCYQIYSYIYPKELTIIITPLISLMKNQLELLNPLIKGKYLNHEQNEKERKEIMKRMKEYNVLFISPERFCSKEFLKEIKKYKIGMICIDEIHCISEWSHHFRTSYLYLKESINELNISLKLGLTATCHQLCENELMNIFKFDKIIKYQMIPKNIHLNMIHSIDKMKDLLKILKEHSFQSLIIYVMFKNDVDILIEILKENGIDSCIGYHSDMKNKTFIEKEFLENRKKILISTIAFGLGINHLNIDGIIHYHLPKSIEDYIQEIGRSGRNGQESNCYLLYNQDDYHFLLSKCFSNYLTENEIKNILLDYKNNQDDYHFLLSKCFSNYLTENEIKNILLDYKNNQLNLEKYDISIHVIETILFLLKKYHQDIQLNNIIDLSLNIYKELQQLENINLYKVYSIYQLCLNHLNISDYFKNEIIPNLNIFESLNRNLIKNDILLLKNQNHSPKEITKILLGISSPNLDLFKSHSLWGKYRKYHFRNIFEFTNEIFLKE